MMEVKLEWFIVEIINAVIITFVSVPVFRTKALFELLIKKMNTILSVQNGTQLS